MNTTTVLRKWTEVETTVSIAERTGVERSTLSRQLGGKAPVLAKHLAAYLEHAPDDLRAELLGAWLRDTVPPELHPTLLGEGGLPLPHVGEWSPSPDAELLDRMTYVAHEAMMDPDLRRMVIQFADWMGYDRPLGRTGAELDSGDVDPPNEHKTSTVCSGGDVLLS